MRIHSFDCLYTYNSWKKMILLLYIIYSEFFIHLFDFFLYLFRNLVCLCSKVFSCSLLILIEAT